MNVTKCFVCSLGIVFYLSLSGCVSRTASVPVFYARNLDGSQRLPAESYAVQKYVGIASPNSWSASGTTGVTTTTRVRPVPPPTNIAAEDAWIYNAPNPNNIKQEALTCAALGIIFFREGNYIRAEIYTSRALELMPRHQCTITHHAACLARLGQTMRARAEFEQAVRLAPESADADQARKWLAKLQDK